MPFVPWHAWRLRFKSHACVMNELIVHNTQGLCRTELGFAIICGIRDIAQTWTNTEPNCSRLPKLCKTVSVIFLYMWHASRKLQVGEKSKHFKYFVIIYWQYPVGALFWQTAFWLMLKICTNSLILFLFLKREFRLVSKTIKYTCMVTKFGHIQLCQDF